MNSASWNERYAANDLVWSLEANRWVVEVASDLEPGRALDLAAGEGRNAIWLVEQGWEAKAVDFSEVAIERAKALVQLSAPAQGRVAESAGGGGGVVYAGRARARHRPRAQESDRGDRRPAESGDPL